MRSVSAGRGSYVGWPQSVLTDAPCQPRSVPVPFPLVVGDEEREKWAPLREWREPCGWLGLIQGAEMAERLRVWLVGGHECILDLGESSAQELMKKIESAGDRNWFSSDDGRSRVRGSAIVRIEIEGQADTPNDPVEWRSS